MNLFKKRPILGIVLALVAVGAIFLMRTMSDNVNSETAVSKGQKFYKAGNYDEAITYFNSGIELDDKNYKGYFSRGLCYKAQGRLKEALVDYNMAIELSPESDKKTLFYTRGQIKYELGMDNDACQDMAESVRRGSPDAVQFSNMYCN
jgi:tetratricopeptide (TPR) repeat protein